MERTSWRQLLSGASFTLVGRAYLYGLMAGGRDGVDRAIEILSGQVVRTMRLLGVKSLERKLTPAHVTQLAAIGTDCSAGPASDAVKNHENARKSVNTGHRKLNS